MDQDVVQSCDVFLSEPWFDLLSQYGFAQPLSRFILRLGSEPDAPALHLRHTREGRCVESLSNYYTGLYGPVGGIEPLEHDDWVRAVQFARKHSRPTRWHLQPLDGQTAWVQSFSRALKQAGFWVGWHFAFGNWYQPVNEGGFAAYWAARPSALRNTVARARRRLDKIGDWRLEVLTGQSSALSLRAAIDAYVSVYNQSWKAPEPRSDFMPCLMRLAADQGWLRLGLVWVADEPVAAQVWLVAGSKANIFKLAYVKGQEKLSAGSVLTAELMHHVMDVDQVQEVDFLSGDDPYKADWMALRRERVGLVAFDQRHWLGWLAGARHLLGRWRERWRAAGRPTTGP